MIRGIVIDDKDNVIVAIYPLKTNTEISYRLGDVELPGPVVRHDIPLFHKVARSAIPKGEPVIKYGEFIGVATCDISEGDYVHTHNCVSSDDLYDETKVM